MMENAQALKVFEAVQVSSHWDAAQEKWYFSIVDVVQALTRSERQQKYWSDLKSKLAKEGSEVSEKIGQLKMVTREYFLPPSLVTRKLTSS